MPQDEVITVDSDSSDGDVYIDRRAVLEPVVRRVVDALGGYESGKYRLGDEVHRCLQDLKKLWRKDDTDDERTVARIFWDTRVLPNDLVPILLATAGQGLVEDKRAISCADLMAAMTWPIDMAEELKELDEELDKGTDYTQLLLSHLNYKAAMLKPGVMAALFGIVLPPLSKSPKERTTRDGQIVNVVLHIVRNLAFIQDLPPNMHLSSDQAEYSSLQSKLIKSLSDSRMHHLLLIIATNASNDPALNSWNTLVLEIFYLLFRGVKPSSLAQEQQKQVADNLHRLLAKEESLRKNLALTAPSRHSRFGTTITISLNSRKAAGKTNKDGDPNADMAIPSQALIFYRQRALDREAGSIIDASKPQKAKKANKVDDLTREDNLSVEARGIVRNLATEFVQSCFNVFLAGLLKDIKSERAKIVEKDHLRLLYVTKWFMEFFFYSRALRISQGDHSKWSFGWVAEIMERGYIIWVLKRMREAVEEKPKLWNEVQAGIECLTQLLLLIDSMSSAKIADTALSEAANLLQQQLVYNGEVLDIALESLRSYKEGVQSLTFLDSAVHLSYTLLRMLERWGETRGEDMYVRKKRTKRWKKTGRQGDDVPDVEEEEASESEQVVHEAMFSFEAFEMKFAHPDIAHTLLMYLARYKDFACGENMKRVVGLMHRQAVRAKAEGLFFTVSTLELFKTILAEQKSLPKEQPYKDLVNLINFILRKFFKSLAEDPFLAVETFFPKNRGQWKHFSSWEPEKRKKDMSTAVKEIRVKKGHSWSDQFGIAIALLVKNGKVNMVKWTRDILAFVIEKRQAIIDETDGKTEGDALQEAENSRKLTTTPSDEALSKFTDYPIPCITNEHAEGARDPEVMLLFRLVKLQQRNEDGKEPEWYVPARVTPAVLKRVLVVLEQFLETPYDPQGKDLSKLVNKRRRRQAVSSDSDPDTGDLGELKKKKKHEKKKQEDKQYKSATFIEDSDAEYGDIDAFLEKEKVLRERMSRISNTSGRIPTMKATGTKKRRRREDTVAGKKRKANDESVAVELDAGDSDSDRSMSPAFDSDRSPSPKTRPRPRPRRIVKPRIPDLSSDSEVDARGSRESPSRRSGRTSGPIRRLVISDDED